MKISPFDSRNDMKRKLKITLVIAVIIGLTGLVYYSSNNARRMNVEIPKCAFSINGVVYDNNHERYPIITYNGQRYFPMTSRNANALGLMIQWAEDGKLIVTRNEEGHSAEREEFVSKNPRRGYADRPDYDIIVNGKLIENNDEKPMLLFRGVTYFPDEDIFKTEFLYESMGTENTLIIQSVPKKIARKGSIIPIRNGLGGWEVEFLTDTDRVHVRVYYMTSMTSHNLSIRRNETEWRTIGNQDIMFGVTGRVSAGKSARMSDYCEMIDDWIYISGVDSSKGLHSDHVYRVNLLTGETEQTIFKVVQ